MTSFENANISFPILFTQIEPMIQSIDSRTMIGTFYELFAFVRLLIEAHPISRSSLRHMKSTIKWIQSLGIPGPFPLVEHLTKAFGWKHLSVNQAGALSAIPNGRQLRHTKNSLCVSSTAIELFSILRVTHKGLTLQSVSCSNSPFTFYGMQEIYALGNFHV